MSLLSAAPLLQATGRISQPRCLGDLVPQKDQFVLRVAHEDIQLDAMKLRFSKQSSLQRLSHSPDLYRTPSPIQVIADRP